MSAFEFLNDLLLLAKGTEPGQPLAWDEMDGLYVSTVVTGDLGPETAIGDAGGVYPVERYTSTELALEGHARWLRLIADSRGEKLTITRLGYGHTIPDKNITLTRQPTEL